MAAISRSRSSSSKLIAPQIEPLNKFSDVIITSDISRANSLLKKMNEAEIINNDFCANSGKLCYAKIIFSWFVLMRYLCKFPGSVKLLESINIEFPDMFVMNQYDSIDIKYANPSTETYYLHLYLITMTGAWCNAKWNFDINTKIERFRLSMIRDKYNQNKIIEYRPSFLAEHVTGYVRFDISPNNNFLSRTPGCLKYVIKNLKVDLTFVVTKVDKEFSSIVSRFRPPEISLDIDFENIQTEIFWFPFEGSELPNDKYTTNIENLDGRKMESILNDFIEERIKKNRKDLINRFIRNFLNKVLTHLKDDVKNETDFYLTIATVFMNGRYTDLYAFPKDFGKFVKKSLRSAIKLAYDPKILGATNIKVPQCLQPKTVTFLTNPN